MNKENKNEAGMLAINLSSLSKEKSKTNSVKTSSSPEKGRKMCVKKWINLDISILLDPVGTLLSEEKEKMGESFNSLPQEWQIMD